MKSIIVAAIVLTVMAVLFATHKQTIDEQKEQFLRGKTLHQRLYEAGVR